MYLAIILGLCAFVPAPTGAAVVLRAAVLLLVQESPTQQDVPAAPSSQKSSEEKPPTATSPREPPQPKAAEKEQPKTTTPAKKHRRKHNTASDPNAAPEKKVVRNGGTGDPVVQLAPGLSQEQASRKRQSTTELLAATAANLKQISGRQLNSSQQDSVSQIRKYMEQAQAAEKAGDVQRAQNLASKALLLSDDLVKH
jgi:outer membrane biosynthesis protein TonB